MMNCYWERWRRQRIIAAPWACFRGYLDTVFHCLGRWGPPCVRLTHRTVEKENKNGEWAGTALHHLSAWEPA